MTSLGMVRRLAGTLVLFFEFTTSVIFDQNPIIQTAKTKITTRGSSYSWPEANGHPDSYGVSLFTAPRNLSSSLAWKHKVTSANALPYGIVLDDIGHVYLASTDGIRAFNAEGMLLWQHPLKTFRIPCLADGLLYVTDNDGNLNVLNMQTGSHVWSRRFTSALGSDISTLGISDGVLITESRGSEMENGASHVAGLDASDGSVLWEHKVDETLWNFMPMFTDYGTVVFQDKAGGLYHVNVANGKRIWKVGSSDGHFTDGMITYGNNDIVYSVHTEINPATTNQTSIVHAYRLVDGRLLWQQEFPYPANSQPVVGLLGSGVDVSTIPTLVVPIGAQYPVSGSAAYGGGFLLFGATDGRPKGGWIPKVGEARKSQIEEDGTCHRKPYYGSPSIDAKGTLYLGHFNGMIYAIRDDDGDGKIDGQTEVSSFDTQAGFMHGGIPIGLQTLATASCDTLYVFKT